MNTNLCELDSIAIGNEIVAYAKENKLTYHPFFQRLSAEEVNITALWVYFVNLRDATYSVPKWLCQTAADSLNTAVRSFFVGIVYDELGAGKLSNNHPGLIQKLVDGLAPWKPQGMTDEELLAPGKLLHQRMSMIFEAKPVNAYHVLGSLLAGEVASRDMITCLAKLSNVRPRQIPKFSNGFGYMTR